MNDRMDWGSRRLVLIDIENVVGGLVCDEKCAACARLTIHCAVGAHPMDQVVVATCHKGYEHVAWSWPKARRLVRSGKDGADLALLDVLREDVASRFAHVVLVSGDGIFADAVRDLGSRGTRVSVVSRRTHLSNRLRLAASDVVLLDEATLAPARRAS